MPQRPTIKRKRRPVEAGEYTDPDLNFEKPVPEDGLERALAEDTVLAMTTAPFKAVTPKTTVEEVMKEMVRLDIACVVVLDKGKLAGIISERDVLGRVADAFAKVRGRPCTEVMTRDPVFVHDTDTVALALNLMAVGGFRHVPILDVDDKVVGIIGPRRILAYLEPHIGARK